MNIFETIGSVTSGIERYHSQFLADALRASLNGRRSLFDGVWRLAAPQSWEIPDCAEVSVEKVAGSGRIDICIQSDHPVKRIIGIEVKTLDDSAEFEQLERYRKGLQREFSEYCIQVSYLTPFNIERAGKAAGKLRTVQVFDRFMKVSRDARHLSWLDVADICWDGNDLWKQHQAYVRKHISSCRNLKELSVDRDRGLDVFFSKDAEDGFFAELVKLGIQPGKAFTEIDLSEFQGNLSLFAVKLVNALKILINTDNVSRDSKRSDKIAEGLREMFLESRYREVHEALFRLSEQFCHVWVQGEGNYGVRTAHKVHQSSGVSLVTSRGADRLVVVQRR